MTRLLLLICLFFTLPLQNIFAQKVNLDKRKFKTEFSQLPSDRTLSYFDTYSVDFFAEQAILDQMGLYASTINPLFDLEGYVYTKEEEAQFNYSITIEKPILIYEGIENTQQRVKNQDGSIRVVTSYFAVASYSIPTTICIKLIPYGTVMYTSTFSTSTKPTVYRSAAQTTQTSALGILNFKTRGINVYASEKYRTELKAEVKKLNDLYCFQSITSSNLLWEVDEKRAPELAPFNVEVNNCIAVLEKLDKKTPIIPARTEMASSIAYWLSMAKDIKPNNKKLIKLKFACLYNAAVCQYYLEMYEDCNVSCDDLIANKHNKSDGIALKNQVGIALLSMEKSGLTSRHQKRLGYDSTAHYEYIKSSRPKQ